MFVTRLTFEFYAAPGDTIWSLRFPISPSMVSSICIANNSYDFWCSIKWKCDGCEVSFRNAQPEIMINDTREEMSLF